MRLISICDYSKLDIREAAVPNSALLTGDVHTLYSRHHGWLHNWLRAKLGNSFDAADLAQDTLHPGAAAPAGKPRREPRAYLTAIAKRLMLNHRRRALEQAYLDALAVMPPALAPSVEQRLLILEALHEIDEMLSGLPGPVREAFLLAQLEGLSQGEIAARLMSRHAPSTATSRADTSNASWRWHERAGGRNGRAARGGTERRPAGGALDDAAGPAAPARRTCWPASNGAPARPNMNMPGSARSASASVRLVPATLGMAALNRPASPRRRAVLKTPGADLGDLVRWPGPRGAPIRWIGPPTTAAPPASCAKWRSATDPVFT